MSHDNNLTPKQITQVTALLERKTLEHAAQAAGVAYITAKRWRRRPEFAAALAEARREMISSALDVLTLDRVRGGAAASDPGALDEEAWGGLLAAPKPDRRGTRPRGPGRVVNT